MVHTATYVTGLFQYLSCCHACENEVIIERYRSKFCKNHLMGTTTKLLVWQSVGPWKMTCYNHEKPYKKNYLLNYTAVIQLQQDRSIKKHM